MHSGQNCKCNICDSTIKVSYRRDFKEFLCEECFLPILEVRYDWAIHDVENMDGPRILEDEGLAGNQGKDGELSRDVGTGKG